MSGPDVNKPRIALLGVPIEIGAAQAGTLMGPAALRTAASRACLNNWSLPSRTTVIWHDQ